MRRILFVDDEPKVLEGLQRMLRSMRHKWEIEFAPGGAAALEALAQKPFDVVVSDMRMPGMNGAQLLTEVRKQHPQVMRIILSGYSDQEMIMKSVGPAHQYLSKPCDATHLKVTVERACALRDLLTNDSLQRLVSQIQLLPSLPSLYVELIGELQSSNASTKKVAEIIAQDLGMSTKILQLVNSAFFGLRQTVSSPAEAASLLGVDTIMSLVLSHQIFSQFSQAEVPGFSSTALWSHSLAVGVFSKRIAKAEDQEHKMTEDAFAAGLLHDSGKLVLAANLPSLYSEMLAQADAQNLTLVEAERKCFGAAHPEVGAYLLGLWGLPDTIVEAVAFHHDPSQCPAQSFSPLTAVHVANTLHHEALNVDRKADEYKPDLDYLTHLGLAERLPAWREVCAQAA